MLLFMQARIAMRERMDDGLAFTEHRGDIFAISTVGKYLKRVTRDTPPTPLAIIDVNLVFRQTW